MIQQFCIKQNLSREVCEWFSHYITTASANIEGSYKYLVYDKDITSFSEYCPFKELTLKEFRKEILGKNPSHVHAELIKKWADDPTIKIEFFNVFSQKWELKDITYDGHIFSDEYYEYRIKLEPTYVPFTFEDAENLIGKAVKTKCKRAIMNIVFLNKEGISLSNGIEGDYKFLFDNYIFLDGSPCGKLNK